MEIFLYIHVCVNLFVFMVPEVCSAEDIMEEPHHLLLGDKNWDKMLEGEWMVKFYAPWCPACRAMEQTWDDFAKWGAQNDDHSIKVGSVDVTSEPALNGRFMITALPTIYHIFNGEFRQYTSTRELEDLKTFITSAGWKEINPVSSWTSPTSFIMSSISRLFSFSMELKSYHNTLNSDYGFPTWLSMLLFGLLIITIGLLLGMGLVLASDYIWGPPQYYDDSIFDKQEQEGKVGQTDDKDVNASKEDAGELQIDESEAKENDNEGSNLRQRKIKSDEDD